MLFSTAAPGMFWDALGCVQMGWQGVWRVTVSRAGARAARCLGSYGLPWHLRCRRGDVCAGHALAALERS